MSPPYLYNNLGNKKMQAWTTSTQLLTTESDAMSFLEAHWLRCVPVRVVDKRHAEDKDLSVYSKTIEYIKLISVLFF